MKRIRLAAPNLRKRLDVAEYQTLKAIKDHLAQESVLATPKRGRLEIVFSLFPIDDCFVVIDLNGVFSDKSNIDESADFLRDTAKILRALAGKYERAASSPAARDAEGANKQPINFEDRA